MLPLTELKLSTVFVILTVITYIFYLIKRKYDYWSKRSVTHVGFSGDVIFNLSKHRSSFFKDLYRNFQNKPFVGFYQFGQPHILVRDLELIKIVLIKQFSHFTDHHLGPFGNDPLLVNSLFHLKGQRWKVIRAKLSPIFTSGKLRHMTGLLNVCVTMLDKHLERTLAESGGEIEMRDVTLKFAMDVIGVCAFGLNCNAIESEDSEFRQIMRKAGSAPTLKLYLILFLDIIHPKITEVLKIRFSNPEFDEFFYSLADQALKHRSDTETRRDDFVQLLMEVREEERKLIKSQNQNEIEPLFTDDVIAANIWVIFTAGWDTVGTTTSYCMYELALHPDLQEKLFEEIKEVQDKNGGQCTYDVLKQMHYLDCVVNETLRLHPNLPSLDRVCTKPCNIPESSLIIEENMNIIVPIQELHLDPEYWPDPERFDPERFNEQNKSNIVPGSYIPFGDGPRMCIGNRFALMVMKAFLAFIVRKYSVHPTAKTEIPITLDPKFMTNTPKHGIHLRFQKRDDLCARKS